MDAVPAPGKKPPHSGRFVLVPNTGSATSAILALSVGSFQKIAASDVRKQDGVQISLTAFWQQMGMRAAKPDMRPVAQRMSTRVQRKLESGVRDIRTCQGWIAVVGGIEIDVLARALVLCPTKESVSHPTNSITEVNPRFILAQAWQFGRLSNACQRRREGVEDDPIRVSGIELPGIPTYYQVSNGMHRTVAARLAGNESIRAYVSGIRSVDPRRLRIVDRVPWHFDERWGWERSIFGMERTEVVDLLRSFEVECRETCSFWLRTRLSGQVKF